MEVRKVDRKNDLENGLNNGEEIRFIIIRNRKWRTSKE